MGYLSGEKMIDMVSILTYINLISSLYRPDIGPIYSWYDQFLNLKLSSEFESIFGPKPITLPLEISDCELFIVETTKKEKFKHSWKNKES